MATSSSAATGSQSASSNSSANRQQQPKKRGRKPKKKKSVKDRSSEEESLSEEGPTPLEVYLNGPPLICKRSSGEATKTIALDKVLDKVKMVGLFFNAHWCPHSRRFCLLLRSEYERLLNEEMEIVSVSLDSSERHFNQGFLKNHGDWVTLPFEDERIDLVLKEFDDVRGLPTLLIVALDGRVIDRNGRDRLENEGAEIALDYWISRMKDPVPSDSEE